MSSAEKEKMIQGDLYDASDAVLLAERKRARAICHEYNNSHPDEFEKKNDLLKGLLGSVEGKCVIEPRFQCDYGYNIHLGPNFYANYDLIILDVCEVKIGANCLVGPRVSILTASHPTNLQERATGLEYGNRVHIGNNVWIGAGVIINPGVKVGDNAIIASGAVVTKDVDAHSLVAGVPAREIRKVE